MVAKKMPREMKWLLISVRAGVSGNKCRVVTANNVSVLDYRMLWQYNSAECLNTCHTFWHETPVKGAICEYYRYLSRDSTYGICETTAVLLLILLLSAWALSVLATKRLSSFPQLGHSFTHSEPRCAHETGMCQFGSNGCCDYWTEQI